MDLALAKKKYDGHSTYNNTENNIFRNSDQDVELTAAFHSFLFKKGAIEAMSIQSGMKLPRIRKQLLAHKSPNYQLEFSLNAEMH